MKNEINKEKRSLPELLAPAGSFEALEAAIEGGADAVYFGAGDFNARMRAKNFSGKELDEALRLCAIYGVRSYVTVNTRLRDRELIDALKLAEKIYLGGAGAVIAADLGLVSLINKYIPDLELHASTQLSGHSSLDAKALSDLGFTRMVCPREMSLSEIKGLCESSPIDIEMFIHGAHCVSFSGQCMMSYAMGGRSGNRGMCAQPCRLPFDMPGVKNRYPLSLSDMCFAGMMADVIDSGVSSLKIEGRQKSAEYVYGVTSVYRKLLDERRNATEDEVSALARLFNRGGFTSGYLKHSYSGMLGVRSSDDAASSKKEGAFEHLRRKVRLNAELELDIGKEAKLTVSDGRRSAVSYGQTVTEDTSGRAMSEDAARQNVSRLGATPYELLNFSFKAEKNAFCTLSEINRLRRDAVEKLMMTGERRVSAKLPEKIEKAALKRKSPILTAEFPSSGLVSEKALGYFDRIYVPLKDAAHADGRKICVALPPLMFDDDIPYFEEKLKGYSGEIMVHGLGQALFAKRLGLDAVSSFRLNVFNTQCAEVLAGFVPGVCISPEVPPALLCGISACSSLIIYGKIPLMHTQRCMMSNGGESCPFKGFGGRSGRRREKKPSQNGDRVCDGALCRTYMTDRRGAEFFVMGLEDCSNMIYNSVPVYMADKKEYLSSYPADRYHFIFSDEDKKKTDFIIESYIKEKAPQFDVRRIK